MSNRFKLFLSRLDEMSSQNKPAAYGCFPTLDAAAAMVENYEHGQDAARRALNDWTIEEADNSGELVQHWRREHETGRWINE